MKLSIVTLFLVVGLVAGWTFRFLTESEVIAVGATVNSAAVGNMSAGASPLPITSSFKEQGGFVATAPETPEELASAFRGALIEPLQRRRLRDFIALLDQLTPQNAAAIRAQLATWPREDAISRLCRNLFFERCGEVEGLSVLDAARAAEHGVSRPNGLLHAAIKGWATADTAAVHRYIESLGKEDGLRTFAIAAVVGALAQQDLQAAGDYTRSQSFPDDGSMLAVYQSLIREAEERERPDIFADWFDQTPEGPAKPLLAKKTVEHLRTESPEVAAEWLASLGTPAWRDAELYWPTALAWAEKDPKAAFDWVVQIPPLENDIAPPGFRAVIEAWNQKDAEGVTAWVLQNTGEPWWPRAASGVVKSFRRDNRPQDADAFLARFPQELQQAILKDLEIGPGGWNARVP